MTTEFKISDTDEIIGKWDKTRNGFKHTAKYYKNGALVEEAKVNYLNRTWESYEYETAINKLLDKMKLPGAEKKHILGITSGKSHGETERKFGNIAAIAQMGEIFGNSQKEKNNWKARMLKAGLGGQGLEMSEDFDKLDENEKERRLNLVIEELKKKKIHS